MTGQELKAELERIWQQPGARHFSERNKWVWGQRPVRYNEFMEKMIDAPVAIPGPSLAPRKPRRIRWPK